METKKFKCQGCSADLEYSPGTSALKCPYCGYENEFESTTITASAQVELDLSEYLAKMGEEKGTVEVQIAKCDSCGGEITLEPNITTAECGYCGAQIVSDGHIKNVIKPQYILPFKITKDESQTVFKTWLKKLWFAPNKLKRYAKRTEPLKGFYMPYWTFDSDTQTAYFGERGTEYTVRDKDGRTSTRVSWTNVSGNVNCSFDDLLVPAGKSLPEKLMYDLDEWDLDDMAEYKDSFITGFTAETYTVELEEGYEAAKNTMSDVIDDRIREDIGGDRQRIHTKNTQYSNVTFKYILLPIWYLVYKFKEKMYRVLINGQNGQIVGERPWSVLKIVALILLIIAILAGAFFAYRFVSGKTNSDSEDSNYEETDSMRNKHENNVIVSDSGKVYKVDFFRSKRSVA